ncbi:hypothetical protein TRVA0_011S03202 [Trichomonascus vanleenenianus]|uniref:uncharacterized protein n=1 Tax=Trichomonascus vanleenenianus TaxID=2268995 RepID=UPI003ECB448A
MLRSRVFLRGLQTAAKNRTAFAFDIDGVLIRGSQTIPEAPKALAMLNERQIPWILLTNGGGKSEKDRCTELAKKLGGGIDISEKQFLQSHTPFQELSTHYERVLVIGGDGDRCRHVAKSYGFKDVVITADIVRQEGDIWPFHRFSEDMLSRWADKSIDLTKPFDAVLVFNDPRDMGVDTQIVLDLLLSHRGRLGTRRNDHSGAPAVPIHFSNNDLLWANSYSLPRFGQGAFRITVEALYKAVTGHHLESTIIGKPYAYTYEYAERMLRQWAPGADLTVYMVGDNPASDIMGANSFGWRSMLVRTGVFKDQDLPNIVAQPDYIFDNVLEAVQFALSGKDKQSPDN